MKQDSGYYVIIYRGGRQPEIIRFAIVKKTNTSGSFLYRSTREKRVFKKFTTRVLNKYYSCTSDYIKPWKLGINPLIPDSCRESLKSVVDRLVSEYTNYGYGNGFEKIKILCSYETK